MRVSHPLTAVPRRLAQTAFGKFKSSDKRHEPIAASRTRGDQRRSESKTGADQKTSEEHSAATWAMCETVLLLEGIWKGDAWSAHVGNVAALAVVFERLNTQHEDLTGFCSSL